jgi:hypothetical protein
VAKPHQQAQRGRMKEQSKEVSHEAVITQSVRLQFPLQLFVPILAPATLGVFVVYRRGQNIPAQPVSHNSASIGSLGVGFNLDHNRLRLCPTFSLVLLDKEQPLWFLGLLISPDRLLQKTVAQGAEPCVHSDAESVRKL